MSKLFIQGVAYTPVFEKNYKGSCYTASEMTPYLAKQCIGLPVLLQHDWDHPPVGKVTSAHIDDAKNLIVVLECDIPFFNDYIYSTITNNNSLGMPFFRALSLGKTHKEIRSDYSVEIQEKRPTEISLVPLGDRPNTWITDFELFP